MIICLIKFEYTRMFRPKSIGQGWITFFNTHLTFQLFSCLYRMCFPSTCTSFTSFSFMSERLRLTRSINVSFVGSFLHESFTVNLVCSFVGSYHESFTVNPPTEEREFWYRHFFLMSFLVFVLRRICYFQRSYVEWCITVTLISFYLMADNVEHL